MNAGAGRAPGRAHDFAAVVAAYEAAVSAPGPQHIAQAVPVEGPLVAAATAPVRAADAPVALLFSPHPDDEVITGAAALRLRLESGWRVVNIAVTLGSKLDRRAPRWAELQDACADLGFELHSATGEDARALTEVRPARRGGDPDARRADDQALVNAASTPSTQSGASVSRCLRCSSRLPSTLAPFDASSLLKPRSTPPGRIA